MGEWEDENMTEWGSRKEGDVKDEKNRGTGKREVK